LYLKEISDVSIQGLFLLIVCVNLQLFPEEKALFEKAVQRRIFESKRQEITGKCNN
jgi:hypothetical protein